MKARRYTRCLVAVLLVFGWLTGVGLGAVAAPAVYPNCNWNCNANDVQVTDAWLELSSGECGCDPSDPTALTAELWVRLWNHTGTDRRDIAFVGDLYINNTLVQQLDGCTDPLPAGMTADLYLGQFQYRCGETVDLAEVVVSWVPVGMGPGVRLSTALPVRRTAMAPQASEFVLRSSWRLRSARSSTVGT